MIRTVLVAYDASEQAGRAFDFALDLAGRYGAEVLVLAVARPPEPPVAVETAAVLEHATQYYEKHFVQLREKAGQAGIPARFEVRSGHPAEQIILLATEAGADMVVMGHRGKTLVQKWMLGSVCRRVLNYAHCTVSVVR